MSKKALTSPRAGLLALAAGLFATGAFAADPIKIGVTIAQSPPGSVSQGVQVRDGVEVAAKMINDAGGVLGRPIELVFEDTQGIPEKARAAVEKLITRDKVVAVTGEHQSSAALAGIEVAHRYKVPYLNTNAWSDVVREKGYAEVFNPGNFNSRVAIAAAETIKAMGAKRVLAFPENTDYGVGLAKLIGEQIKEKAPGVEYKFETLDRAAKDFLPALLPLKANPPDVVVEIMLPPAAYILINQLNEQGIAPTAKTLIYDASGIADYPDFWQNVSDSAKNMLVFGLYHPKMQLPDLGQESRRRLHGEDQERAQPPAVPGRRQRLPDRRGHQGRQGHRWRRHDQGARRHQVDRARAARSPSRPRRAATNITSGSTCPMSPSRSRR